VGRAPGSYSLRSPASSPAESLSDGLLAHPHLPEHLDQAIGVVRHDTVHAALQALAHLRGLVDRPHVDRDAPRMGQADQLPGEHRDAQVRARDLERGDVRNGEPAQAHRISAETGAIWFEERQDLEMAVDALESLKAAEVEEP